MMQITEKNGTAKTVVIVVLAILLAVETGWICVLMNRSNSSEEEIQQETDISAESSMNSDLKTIELYTVTTDALDFSYASVFSDRIYAEIHGSDVTFLADVEECKGVRLFTMGQNGDSKNQIGMLLDKEGHELFLILTKHTYEGSLKAETVERLNRIRDTLIDEIVSNLQFEEGPYQLREEDTFLTENMAIDTDYVQLFYPQKWESYLSTTDSGDTIEFFCCLENRKPIKLFTVQFHNDAIDCVGTVNDIPVALTLEDIPADDSWSEDEQETVYTMLEDSYVIIDGLIRYNGLTLNQ